MSTPSEDQIRQEQTIQFMKQVFDLKMPAPPAVLGPGILAHTTLTRRNQPEFYAGAPWRLEPDGNHIPLLIVVREANVTDPGLGPWHLDELRIEQRLAGGAWHKIRGYRPYQLADVNPDGSIDRTFWTFATRIPLARLQEVDLDSRGQQVDLRVAFDGRFPTQDNPGAGLTYRYLQVDLASHALPLGRAAHAGGPRQWFYGDTHYHSSHTNDIWEFGYPVRQARRAGRAIGLDWMAITDHSCDLDEPDLEDPNLMRWERLRQELGKWSVSNHRYRMLLGEEITLVNSRGGYVHMLALGPLHDLIPGAFWSAADVGVKRVVELLYAFVSQKGGYPPGAMKALFGQVLGYDQVLDLLGDRVLIFAAHPYDTAQPPGLNGTWVEDELAHHDLNGHEFWNGRIRRRTDTLVDPTANPFDEPEWNDPHKLEEHDKERVDTLRERVENKWEAVLCRGVDNWASAEPLPRPRPVFAAGSDAHGDFNHCVGIGWNYKEHGSITDNALGRVRTVLHLPRHTSDRVPTRAAILAALERGACLVTDGPVLACTLQQDGQVTHMGEVATLADDGPVELEIVAHTTPEFGPVPEVEVFTYLKGQQEDRPQKTTVGTGASDTIVLDGQRGYCRVQAQSLGSDREPFCCITNPIWVRIPGGGERRVYVTVRQQMAD
jgi:hypothetical protein